MSFSSSSIPFIFDPGGLRRNRDRAAKADPSHHFLPQWCMDQLADRLGVIRRGFSSVLQIGALAVPGFIPQMDTLVTLDIARGPLTLRERSRLQAAPDMLPFADEVFDLVLSPFALHTVNDLPGALTQVKRVLRPDGLFLAALAGGETLYELRACLMEAEQTVSGGVSPRVFPFADKPQLGALMQRAGFALPVVDSDIVTVTYDNVFKLMHDLRNMGESNIVANRNKRFLSRAVFMEAARLYQDRHAQKNGRISATFEVVFLLGWAPHASQQKPLRPGQSTIRLADALAVEETAVGENATP